MTHIHTSEEIVRTGTGSIDFDYYCHRAHLLRAVTVVSRLKDLASRAVAVPRFRKQT